MEVMGALLPGACLRYSSWCCVRAWKALRGKRALLLVQRAVRAPGGWGARRRGPLIRLMACLGKGASAG